MLASYFTLAARIVRVPVCLWFWIDVRITNWAGQEDFFFFFFSAALDGRRGNDKAAQKRTLGHRETTICHSSPSGHLTTSQGGRHSRTSGTGFRCPWQIQSRRHKSTGYSDSAGRSWIQVVAWGVSVLCDISPSSREFHAELHQQFSSSHCCYSNSPKQNRPRQKILNYFLGWPTRWEIFKPKYLGIATRILED